MWAGVIRLGLPSTTSKPTFISGIDAQRLDQRVADQVGEGDLAAAGAGEVVVDDGAVVPEQLDRHRAHRGRGRHGQRGVHVLRRCGPARRAARCTSARRWPRRARRAATPWAPGWWCPWPARRPWRSGRGLATGGGLRLGLVGRLRARASPRPSLRPWAGLAARPASARLLGCLLGGLADVRWRAVAGAVRAAVARAVGLEVVDPRRVDAARGPAGTGRTSPRRATRWLRSRRRAFGGLGA